jgi:hypothetical protein
MAYTKQQHRSGRDCVTLHPCALFRTDMWHTADGKRSYMLLRPESTEQVSSVRGEVVTT